ncbi:histidine decarboxylase [Gemmata sp.]|uniref:histidine decarboxylase n=1 Tax=Gemmata sp. TaxID=1914242 RepID=UPI003F6FA282
MPEHLTAADAQRLDDLFDRLKVGGERLLGYPADTGFDFSPLYRFLSLHLNNLGDPFRTRSTEHHTHELEREVVTQFARWAGAPESDVWGYVTSGSTEGNLHGLFLARELFPDGVVYHSADSHYSVGKAVRLLRVEARVVRSRSDGCLDLDHLGDEVRRHPGRPAVVVANVGTTMKAAIDDLPGVFTVLADCGADRRYVHADAALSGLLLPFLDGAPPWDFAAGADSISVSGHKMLGCPFPCGVSLARAAHVGRIGREVAYTASLDTTISGSRNAFAPLFLWYALRALGAEGFRTRARRCLELADYACEKLTAAGARAWRHPHANTVVFDRPADAVVRKWHLATEGPLAHIVAMPHGTREQIDELAGDVAEQRPAG